MTNDPARVLLERLLSCVISPAHAGDLTDSLLNAYGTLPAVLENFASDPRSKVPDSARPLLAMIPELYEQIALAQMQEHPLLNTLRNAAGYAALQYVNAPYERVLLLCLDEEYRLKECICTNEGGLRDVPFYPRRLLQEIFRSQAHAAVLCHNHPGGWGFFSEADIAATRNLLSLCAQIRFPLIDHLLISGNQVISMRSRAYIPTDSWMRCGPGTIPLAKWRTGLSLTQEYFINTTLNS